MSKYILVPLDGSQRAEQALPLAAHIARFYHGTINLLRAVEYTSIYAAQMVGTMEKIQALEEQTARNYLREIESSPVLKDISTATELYIGDATSAIIQASKEQHSDLIVLCSHGRTGMKRWVLGSVAQKIARSSAVPVLIQRDSQPLNIAELKAEKTAFRICVALDGSAEAETIRQPALALTLACSPSQHGEIHLVRIVEPLYPESVEDLQRYYQVDIQQALFRAAQDYLDRVIVSIEKELAEYPDIHVTGSVKTGGDIAYELLQYAEHAETPYQVLAMTTHGRSGLERWMLGSIAERVLNQTTLPLLIARPQAHKRAT